MTYIELITTCVNRKYNCINCNFKIECDIFYNSLGNYPFAFQGIAELFNQKITERGAK